MRVSTQSKMYAMGFVCLFILGGVFFAGYAYHGDVEQNQINQLNADLRVTQAALTADEQKLADKKDEKTAQNAAVVTPAASDIVPVIKSTEYAPPAETIQVPAQKTLATKTKELTALAWSEPKPTVPKQTAKSTPPIPEDGYCFDDKDMFVPIPVGKTRDPKTSECLPHEPQKPKEAATPAAVVAENYFSPINPAPSAARVEKVAEDRHQKTESAPKFSIERIYEDKCLNIDDLQVSVPANMYRDADGNCWENKPDTPNALAKTSLDEKSRFHRVLGWVFAPVKAPFKLVAHLMPHKKHKGDEEEVVASADPN